MLKKISKLKEFEKNSLITISLSILTGAFGYLYHIILGNIMSVAQYGIANTMITLSSFGVIFMMPLCAMTGRKIAMLKSQGKEEELNSFIYYMVRLLFYVCFVVSIFFLFFIVKQPEYNKKLWILTGFVIFSNILYTMLISMVQGYKNFALYAGVGTIAAVVKIVVTYAIINLVGEVYSVLLGILISNFLCSIIFMLPTSKYRIVKKYQPKKIDGFYQEIITFYKWSFVFQIMWSFLCNGGEIIIMKIFYSDETVGLYSVAITLCKVGMFCVTAITAVMFPEVAANYKNHDKARRYLRKTCIYGGGILALYLILLNLGKHIVILYMYGTNYMEAANLLGAVSFYIFEISIFSILYQYFIAIGKMKEMSCALTAAVLAAYVFATFHLNINCYIWILGCIMLAVITSAVVMLKRSQGEKGYEMSDL